MKLIISKCANKKFVLMVFGILIIFLSLWLKLGVVMTLDEFGYKYDVFLKKELSTNFLFYNLIGMQDIDQMSKENLDLLLKYCTYNPNNIDCGSLK